MPQPTEGDLQMSGMRVISLTHDLHRKRSLALLVWEDDPEKKLSVPVPFGCSLENVSEAAEKAVRELSREIAAIPVLLS
jgi:hypothetical protein